MKFFNKTAFSIGVKYLIGELMYKDGNNFAAVTPPG